MNELPPFFESIIVPSCRAGLLIACLFLLRYFLGNRLSPAWRHALWGLVPLALLPMMSIPSSLSIYNLLPQTTVETVHDTNIDDIDFSRRTQFVAQDISVESVMTDAPETPFHERRLNENIVVAKTDGRWIGWLVGCFVMILIFLRQTLVCSRWISHAEPVKSERILTIFESCRRQMKTKTWLVVAESTAVSGPFLIGAIRPVLLLPHGMIETASEKQLRTVFLHELAHLKRWDVWTGWLMTLLLIVHWFNPLLWLALRRMNADREEACDTLALETLNQADRGDYAHSLLDITERYVVPDRFSLQTPGLVGISETGKFLTRRIDMIKQIGTWKLRWKIFALVAVFCLGAATLTDAKEKKPKKSAAEIQRKIDKLQTELQKAKDAEKDGKYHTDFYMASLPGSYLGARGNDSFGAEIGKPKNGIYPITLFEGGLPGNGYDIFNDSKYIGTFTMKGDQLTIQLSQKFKGHGEEPVEPELKTLAGNTYWRELSAEKAERTTMTFRGIVISKNAKWDKIAVEKYDSKASVTFPEKPEDAKDNIDPTPLADSDVLVFDGQWKNEKTGAEIAAGTVFKGARGMFRLASLKVILPSRRALVRICRNFSQCERT